MNGFATYDDTTDLGQDYRDPPLDYRSPTVLPPPAAAPLPAPATVAAPGAAPVVPPQAQMGFLSPEEAEQRTTMRRLQYAIQDLPLDEAEKAVSAALKFQAVRGYQKDLAEGKSATEALARWAPIMFTQPKAANLGQAASMVRASRAGDEKYMDIGGVGYMFKGGKATALTPPKVVPPKSTSLVIPANPEDPFGGGHVTIPLEPGDPLVKGALERARKGPAPAPPAPPGLFTKAAWPRLFGPQPTNAEPATLPTVAAPAPAPAAAAKPSTPQEKLDAAKALRRLHPDWTKQQIIDAVNR